MRSIWIWSQFLVTREVWLGFFFWHLLNLHIHLLFMSHGRCDLSLYICTSYIYIYTSLYVLLKILKSNYKKRHPMVLSWPRSTICWAWAEAWTCIRAWASSIMSLGLCHHLLSYLIQFHQRLVFLLHVFRGPGIVDLVPVMCHKHHLFRNWICF